MKKILLVIFILSCHFINGQNNPPDAVSDIVNTYAGAVKSFQPALNDTDPDSNSLALDTFINITGRGTVIKLGNSSLKYTADSFYYGLDTLLYVVCDNGLPSLCDTGYVFIVIEYKFYDNYEKLDINNISARFNTSGSNFWDLVGFAGFEAPKGSGINSIFAESVWIGGLDNSNGLHLAAQTFKNNGDEFLPGPVMDSSVFPPYIPYAYQYEINKWNRMWKINKSEIDNHIASWNQPGYIIPDDILSWPSHGDTTLGQEFYLAPFYDANGDGLYQPFSGDYPQIKGDQTVYFIYNDNFVHEQSGGTPLITEVHGTAYSFNCPDSALYNTVFVNYKFINRSDLSYHDTYLGLWLDGDIGNYTDDFVGCDVQRGTYFFYNGDSLDNIQGSAPGYGNYIPAQAATILAGPIQDADGFDNPLVYNYSIAKDNGGIPYSGLGYGYDDSIIDNERIGLAYFICFNNTMVNGDPAIEDHYYSYMSGLWKDGSQMVYGGNGHPSTGGTLPARYIFPGDSDPLGWGTGGNPQPSWNEPSAGNIPGDRRGVGSVGPFTFDPGEVAELDIAFVFGRDYQNPGANAGLTVMQNRVDAVREMFENDSTPCGLNFSTKSNFNKSKNKVPIKLYPNPAQNFLIVDCHEEKSSFEIYDITGRIIMNGEINGYLDKIHLINFTRGLYFFKLNSGNKIFCEKFMVE